jgi:hypothetical protein
MSRRVLLTIYLSVNFFVDRIFLDRRKHVLGALTKTLPAPTFRQDSSTTSPLNANQDSSCNAMDERVSTKRICKRTSPKKIRRTFDDIQKNAFSVDFKCTLNSSHIYLNLSFPSLRNLVVYETSSEASPNLLDTAPFALPR